MKFRCFVFCALFIFCSCSTTVICPQERQGSLAALVDHGRHASLVVEGEKGSMIRYSFGDWRYYALKETGFFPGARALLWPTTAGLGRKRLPGPVSAVNIKNRLFVEVEEVFVFKADRSRLEKFKDKLDSIFKKNMKTKHYNSYYDLNFVQHPKTYNAINNSNKEIALWLEGLGCKAKGPTFFSAWDVKER